MMSITIVTDETRTVAGEAADDRLLIDPAHLEAALGWQLKPEGLCQGSVCVPVRKPERLLVGGRLVVGAVASALGRPSVIDAEAGIAAIGLPKEQRRAALREQQAPAFTLRDLDGVEHDLDEWRGRKKLLVAFASW
jgi:hypothetical protein